MSIDPKEQAERAEDLIGIQCLGHWSSHSDIERARNRWAVAIAARDAAEKKLEELEAEITRLNAVIAHDREQMYDLADLEYVERLARLRREQAKVTEASK